MSNVVRLHRVLRAPPERVYRAFLDPDAMAKWLPPHGFTGKVHQMDARVGGGYRMSFTNFGTGKSHSFGGRYVELTPHERIRYTDQFDDPEPAGRDAGHDLAGSGRLRNRTHDRAGRAFRRRSRSSSATSGGRNRWRCWRTWSSPRSRMARSRIGQLVKPGLVGYSGTPLAKKLGIVAGSHVATRHAPSDYGDLLEPLPDGVVFDAKVAATTDVVHVFADRRSVLEKELATLRKSIRSNGTVWVSWPKKASKGADRHHRGHDPGTGAAARLRRRQGLRGE